MDTKTVAVITVFAALTIALNLSPVKIPAPYAPYLIYQLWEIPIVAAFLLYGWRVGLLIAIINTLILIIVFPGVLLTGPLYNLAAVLSMLLGIGIIVRVFHRRSGSHEILTPVSLTISGIIFRVGIMSLVNWVFLRFPPPFGFNLPETAILVSLPLIAVFNATLTLYTIPTGYVAARVIKSRIEPV
ncbi:MAG: hypothetical protein PVH12_00995 [Candidatus Bathyarchaeota archaeon]|jgi:riboflavin transporter FmnP